LIGAFIKYGTERDWGAMTCVPSSIEIDSGIQKFLGGNLYSDALRIRIVTDNLTCELHLACSELGGTLLWTINLHERGTFSTSWATINVWRRILSITYTYNSPLKKLSVVVPFWNAKFRIHCIAFLETVKQAKIKLLKSEIRNHFDWAAKSKFVKFYVKENDNGLVVIFFIVFFVGIHDMSNFFSFFSFFLSFFFFLQFCSCIRQVYLLAYMTMDIPLCSSLVYYWTLNCFMNFL
jgi:hypothetical protein